MEKLFKFSGLSNYLGSGFSFGYIIIQSGIRWQQFRHNATLLFLALSHMAFLNFSFWNLLSFFFTEDRTKTSNDFFRKKNCAPKLSQIMLLVQGQEPQQRVISQATMSTYLKLNLKKFIFLVIEMRLEPVWTKSYRNLLRKGCPERPK